MEAQRKRGNIPPSKISQPDPKRAEVLLQQRLISAENDTDRLIEQLSSLGFVPEKLPSGKRSGHMEKQVSTPISPYPSKITDPQTLYKNYETMVTRVCKAESQIQTLKLNFCAMQAEKEIYGTEANGLREQLREEKERNESRERKLKSELGRKQSDFDEAISRRKQLEDEIIELKDALATSASNKSQPVLTNVVEEDKLTKQRLNRKIVEMKEQLMHETELRKSLEDSHNALLQRIRDMESTVEKERIEMQKLVNVCTKMTSETEKLKLEKKQIAAKNKSLEEDVRKLTTEIGVQDKRLKDALQEKQAAEQSRQTTTQLEGTKQELFVKLQALEREAAEWKQQSSELTEALEVAKEETKKARQEYGEETQNLIRKAVEDSAAETKQLHQQLREAQMQVDILAKERHQLEVEKWRLEERIGTIEEQEIIYQKVESSMTELLEGKNRLAYEKGQLHQRLEALQKELEDTTKIQTENKHLKKMKTSLESQIKKANEELTSTQLMVHKLRSNLRQEQNTSHMKERDFEMAIQSRDVALKEAEKLSNQLEEAQREEQIKISGLQRSLSDAQADHSKMTATLDSVMASHQHLQGTVESLQTELGRKDRELTSLKQERQNSQRTIHHLQDEFKRLQRQMDTKERAGYEQVESIQRDLSEAKEDNRCLSQTQEDLLQTNVQLQAALDSLQGQLDSQRHEHQLFIESSEMEKFDFNHQIKLLQEKVDSTQAQLNSQKSLVNKRTQKELSGLQQAHLEVTSRADDLSKKNTELHQKISELEGTVSRLKDRIKSQKSQIDNYRDLKEKNADLLEENTILNSRLKEFQGVKKSFIAKNKEQTETISAFMKEVEQLQQELKELSHDQKCVASKNDRDTKHRESRLHRLEKENASLRERLHDTELDKSGLEMKLEEVSSESEEISKHLQDAHKWFQQKYSGLQQELVDANREQEVLKQAVTKQTLELRKEKLKSDEQTQRAYEMIRASRQTLGKLAVQMEKDHIEAKSQMHFLARRVQAEKDHSTYTEGKYKKMLNSSVNYIEDLAQELDQTRTMLDSVQ